MGAGRLEKDRRAYPLTPGHRLAARRGLLPPPPRLDATRLRHGPERRVRGRHRLRRQLRQPPVGDGFRHVYRAVTAGAAALLLIAPFSARAQGVVRGTVRERQGAPIRGASVVIPGTTLAARTDLDGRFRIPNVPAGTVRLHAAAVGYNRADTTVALTGGDSTTVEFTLSFAPLALPPVDVISDKVPHFGDRPATSVTQVNAQDLDRRAVSTVDEAIDHAPGVQFVNGQINLRGS